jgi:hypothetical protein
MNPILEDPAEAPGWDRGADAAPQSADTDAGGLSYVERLVAHRVPELSDAEIGGFVNDQIESWLRTEGEG